MRRNRTIATIALSTAALVALPTIAEVSPAQAGTPTCSWTVQWPVAGVYSSNDVNSEVIKDKHSGDRVTGYCPAITGVGDSFYVVFLSGDPGDDAYMRLGSLG